MDSEPSATNGRQNNLFRVDMIQNDTERLHFDTRGTNVLTYVEMNMEGVEMGHVSGQKGNGKPSGCGYTLEDFPVDLIKAFYDVANSPLFQGDCPEISWPGSCSAAFPFAAPKDSQFLFFLTYLEIII